MKAIIFAEHRNGQIRKITFENMTLAKSLGLSFDVVVVGHQVQSVERDLGAYGATTVTVLDDPALTRYSPDVYTRVMADAVKNSGAEIVLMGATSTGKDLAPRLSVLLNAALATDCTKVELSGNELQVTRPMYAGKVLAKIRLSSAIKVLTVRPNVYGARENQSAATVNKISPSLVDARTVVSEIVAGAKGKLDVTEADIIVSGGRGMKGPENWHLIEKLAEKLGAATGASRAAVDAGWRSHDEQVGQTGKTVSPTLYIAVGISGAIQHLAGMSSSKYIVAINKDAEAPIFKVADYGIVADLFEIVPRMIDELK